MKKVLIAIAALVIVVIVAAIAAPFFIPVSVYKNQIEARAKQATGRTLAIKGDMSLSLFPSVAIAANDVTFANAQGASTPDMARLKSLKVAVKLMPLLRGGLEIDSFVLEEPQIVLEIDKQGRGNWVMGAPSGTPAPTQVVTVAMPSSFSMRASKRLASASVSWIVEPSGSHRSTSTSGRLESGKNCCCTLLMPNTPSTKTSSIRPMVFQRFSTHQRTRLRKRL